VKCNSNSGTSFDAHGVRRLDAEDFVRGRVNGRVLRATVHVDGIPLGGTAQWTEGGLQLFEVPKQNDPKVQPPTSRRSTPRLLVPFTYFLFDYDDRAGRDRSLASPLTHALPPPGREDARPVATSVGA
jgi:hypothetical protein